MAIHAPSSDVIGYCAGPALVCVFAANAPWIVTVVTGVLASTWYIRQLYKDFKKKDDEPPKS